MAHPTHQDLRPAALGAFAGVVVVLASSALARYSKTASVQVVAPLLASTKPVSTYAFVSPHEIGVVYLGSWDAFRCDLAAPRIGPSPFPVALAFEEHGFAAGSVLFTSPSFSKAIASMHEKWYLFDRKWRVVKPCPRPGLGAVWMKDESGWFEARWHMGQNKTLIYARSLRQPDSRRLVASLPQEWELLGQNRAGHLICIERAGANGPRLSDCDLRSGRMSPIRSWTPSPLAHVAGRLLSPDGKRVAWLVVRLPNDMLRGKLELRVIVATLGSISMTRVTTETLRQWAGSLYTDDSWSGPLFAQWRPDSRAIAWVRHGNLEAISVP